MAKEPGCYVALGDSMSIDDYPANDAWTRWDVKRRALGAGALLYRNDPLWPEFEGRELCARHPGMGYANVAIDGAVIDTVRRVELPGVRDLDATIVTLTAGGNDLLDAILSPRVPLREAVEDIGRRYAELVADLRAVFPRARLVLTTIYDPTDGTGRLPRFGESLPVELLEQTNDLIRSIARRTDGAVLADVHADFQGHGVSAPPEERWYWESSIIEPSARGASEIRRAWWHALERAG